MRAPLLKSDNTGVSPIWPAMLVMVFFVILGLVTFSQEDWKEGYETDVGGTLTKATEPLEWGIVQAQAEKYLTGLTTPGSPESDTNAFFNCIKNQLRAGSPVVTAFQSQPVPPRKPMDDDVLDKIYTQCFNQESNRRISPPGSETLAEFIPAFMAMLPEVAPGMKGKFKKFMIQESGTLLPDIFLAPNSESVREVLTAKLQSWFLHYKSKSDSQPPGYRATVRFAEDVKLSEIYKYAYTIVGDPQNDFTVYMKVGWPSQEAAPFKAQDDIVFGIIPANGPEVSPEELSQTLATMVQLIETHIPGGKLATQNLMPMMHRFAGIVIADYAGGKSFGDTLSKAVADFFFYRPTFKELASPAHLKDDKCFDWSEEADIQPGSITDPAQRMTLLTQMLGPEAWDKCHEHFIKIWLLCKHPTPSFFSGEWPMEQLGEFNQVCLRQYLSLLERDAGAVPARSALKKTAPVPLKSALKKR